MFALRSNFWRLALLPVLLTASLLLPTLHLHPIYHHDHDGQSHQHAIVHSDFLAMSAHDHSDHEEIAFGDSSPSVFSKSSLTALLVRNLHGSIRGPERTPAFLAFDLALFYSSPAIVSRVLKREHSPPKQQAFVVPNSPRSPPIFA